MKIFCSDMHHMHSKIVSFTNRGEETTQENHTEWLVDVWNKNVTPADVCYNLGDYSFAKKYDDIAKFTKRLNGTKILIKGNHDRREYLDQLVRDRLITTWYDYKEIKIGETSVCLFHFPVKFWHKQAHGSIHLHGHLHGANSGLDGKVLDVGIDSAYNLYGKYRFFTERDILNYMKDKNNVESYHAKRTT